jgi:hypothetical protein
MRISLELRSNTMLNIKNLFFDLFNGTCLNGLYYSASYCLIEEIN